MDERDNARLVAIGFLLSGFTAAQVHSFLTHAAMWPRYMLIGAWIHLPVIVMLLLVFKMRQVAWIVSVGCAALAVSQFAYQTTFTTGTDYGAVARHIESSRVPNDAFLVQSMDLWQGGNHFDQLWLERYAVRRLPTVTGGHLSRSKLIGNGLPLASISRDVHRVWVYSHLFRSTWLSQQDVDGWRLAELRNFGGPFPLALFERVSTASAETTVALREQIGN